MIVTSADRKVQSILCLKHSCRSSCIVNNVTDEIGNLNVTYFLKYQEKHLILKKWRCRIKKKKIEHVFGTLSFFHFVFFFLSDVFYVDFE